jgi:signal transduction histidine kinase
MTPASPSRQLWADRWQRLSSAFLRGFHRYASWLVSISWKRFFVLSLLLLVTMAILHDLPPFTWKITERVEVDDRAVAKAPRPPKPPKPPKAAREPRSTASSKEPSLPIPGEGVNITIGRDGVHVTPRRAAATAPPQAAASGSAPVAPVAPIAPVASASLDGVQITLPPGSTADAVREAVEAARSEIEAALEEARADAAEAERDAAEARREAAAAMAEAAVAEAGRPSPRSRTRTTTVGIGDMLMQLTMLWIMGSAVIKATYKGRMQAEVKAAQATETAEAESLKRQVVEARMAAMQAQVEPHFLFNTLASIDHLIETDPARASQMQKNLIALLRASMPTMREANDGGVRDLARELLVIRPYLEILKVRMEERLETKLDVPDGLMSAEFPPMMMQTLVENAIKHGLEPKAEGGLLTVKAEIVHGKLQVSVADTGLGFGRASTSGTGVGLANIRERLQLLYGHKASLTVAENPGGGTVVTITVPYRSVSADAA